MRWLAAVIHSRLHAMVRPFRGGIHIMVKISAYKWAPPFAQGLVHDLRVRWALTDSNPYSYIGLDAIRQP
jgi:hypothetical protein